jgi:uncharacterized protein (TIGR02300 family)
MRPARYPEAVLIDIPPMLVYSAPRPFPGGARPMARDLGTKYVCYKCGTKFYDLKKPVPACPKCGADQREAPVMKGTSTRATRAAPAKEPEEPEVPAAEDEEAEEAEDEAEDDED